MRRVAPWKPGPLSIRDGADFHAICPVLGAGVFEGVDSLQILSYIGPGGGVALTVSIFTILLGIVGIVFAYISWPFTLLLSLLRGKRVRFRYPFRKVVVLGLDGLDPKLVRRFMDEGKLPNFQRLAENGHFSDLATTLPAMTPAAWPSFMTGNDPSHHGIYDFLTPGRPSYLPKLSSYETVPARRTLTVGRWRLPLTAAYTRSLRKGVAFWQTLASRGVECTILRVPITFPPPRFRGRLLSGLCVPDLLGSQGTFTCYTTNQNPPTCSSGTVQPLVFTDGVARPRLLGPPHPLREDAPRLSKRFTVRRTKRAATLRFAVGGERFELGTGEQSQWVPVHFRAGPLSVRGQVRFQLVRAEPHIVLYMSPVQITPERSTMPVSHPRLFADYLAKTQGAFGTLGFLEDTSALNEKVMDETAFLQQARSAFEERRAMFLHALDLKADDLTVCVFDTPDRIQHMFWRYLEDDHPAHRQVPPDPKYADVIERLYLEMDKLVGQTLDRLPPKTLLLVASDHGFTSFRREVDLNAWLHQHGYLHLKEHADPQAPWLEAVDWSRTRAYAMGLSGLFINLRGREGRGTVAPGAAYEALVNELKAKLERLRDPEHVDETSQPRSAVRQAFVAQRHFQGPFRAQGPDLLIGYEPGYRVGWNCAKGRIGSKVFADNTKAWSGDHCVSPAAVPGVLLANAPLAAQQPRLIDLPATILDVFGVKPEAPMQGRSLFHQHEPTSQHKATARPSEHQPVPVGAEG